MLHPAPAPHRSAIEWTDATWNPVTGCTKVSTGCDHCYAETFAERWRGIPGHPYEQGFDVRLWPDRLDIPLRWTKPRRVFVNSMADLFHDQVPDDYIAQVFAVMALAPQHTFQILTKRPGRMASLLTEWHAALHAGRPKHDRDRRWLYKVTEHIGRLDPGNGLAQWPLPNVWLGVSVEDQRWADLRIPKLLATPAAVRFLSCEPLLADLRLRPEWLYGSCPADCGCSWPDDADARECGCYGPCSDDDGTWSARSPMIGWVIAGGESGPAARPMHPHWARNLRDQCAAAHVAFFFKQWGEWTPDDVYDTSGASHVVMLDGRDRGAPWPGWQLDQPTAAVMRRVGNKRAGRELDGRTWDEQPLAVDA